MSDKKRVNVDKGDGKPYLDMLEEEYNKMTAKEKAEVDSLGEKLDELFQIVDDEE